MLTDNLHMIERDKFGVDLDDKEVLEASKIDINQVTLKISKVADISESERQRLFEIFNKFKFVILECDPLPYIQDNLLALKKYFGSIKRHQRSDKNGMTSIENAGEATTIYLANTNQTHPIHTDGAFEIIPPKIVAMQCEKASNNGGLSQIVYAESVYKYLMENHLEELQRLLTYPLTITRGDLTATRSVFIEKEGRISMTFRADSVISVTIPPQLEKAYAIIKNYVNLFRNQLIFKLKVHQIILFDNTSILHGRTSFPENEDRKLNRLWFDGNSEYAHHLQLGFIPKFKLLSNGQN
ncbi:MAG: TauD/TfdA family dioxygenase [Scytonema sp. RU_4_4]|nr:TauD/TfdA family dioxygenase [Scytonema sp. RU_4_4]NJR73249.1 TauD/TfdA family dioxygenase [Scytonema sp. CRU_2_7]